MIYTKQKLPLVSIAVLGLTCAGALLSANAREDDNDDFDGLYMGIAAGGLATLSEFKNSPDHTLFDVNGNELFNSLVGDTLNDRSYDVSGTGEIRLGYGKSFADWFWVGLEIFGNLGDRDLTVTDHYDSVFSTEDPTDITINSDFNNKATVSLNDAEFGIDLRPGVFLTEDTLLYARVGAAFNELELSVNTSFNNEFKGIFDDNSFDNSVHAKNSDNVTGLRLGLGVEQKILSQLSLTLDYIFTDYGNISANNSNTIPLETGESTTVNTSSHADVDTHAVMLGINYYPGIGFDD